MKSSLIAFILALAFPLMAEEGVKLTVTVTNIPGVQGDLLIGLYDSAESFTAAPLPQSPKITVSSQEPVTATIENVKPGRYAIAVIQDLNQNGVLDKNFVGMPKEPLAFSVIDKIPMGKPKFEACSFEVLQADIAMTIKLVLN
ncbi:MAG: DUF2141 domain-containing protein [Verrucomicrobiales bacterium]